MEDLEVSNDIDNFMQSANNADARTNLGLGNVDNIADADKPVSTAQQAADNRRAFAGGVRFDGNGSGGEIQNTANIGNIEDGPVTYHFLINPDTISGGASDTLIAKGGRSNGGYLIGVAFDGLIVLLKQTGSGSNAVQYTKSLPEMNAGQTHALTITLDFSGTFTVNAWLDGNLVIDSETPTVNGTYGDAPVNLQIGRRNSGTLLFPGVIHEAALFNRALSAAEAAELSEIGLSAWLAKYPEDKYAGEEGTVTSGTLTVGKRYRINTFETGDDFTNVGAASNATGVEFVTTGTTPTTWTNSSELEDIGALAAYPMTEGNGRQLRDLSGRYDALLSETGYQHLQQKTEGYVRVKGADANPSIMMLSNSDIIPEDAVWTQIIAEERIVDIANTAQDLADRRIRLEDSTGDLLIRRSDGSNHETLGTVTAPTDTDDVDVEVHYKQVIR